MAPEHPLGEADIAAAVGNAPLPPALKFYTLRTPFVAGAGVAAVGAIGLATLSHPDNVAPVSDPVPTAVELAVDSTGQAEPDRVDVEEVLEVQPVTPSITHSRSQSPSQSVHTLRNESTPPISTADNLSKDTVETSGDSVPVVVKKVLIKNKRTIIVKDSAKL